MPARGFGFYDLRKVRNRAAAPKRFAEED